VTAVSVNRARVLWCAVQRKQFMQARHPGLRIDLVYFPVWHWAASWTSANGVARCTVNYDLDLLLDELSETLDPYGRRPG